MDNVLISIAMATYNGEKFVREQLDSIIEQTISNFELVVCDDCSSDSTWKILQEYANKDKRIKIFQNEKNLGFKKNFEKVINFCSGNYIALSDQDDVWEKKHLEILIDNLKEASGVVGNAFIINSAGLATKDTISKRERYFVDGTDADRLFRILFNGNPFQGASSLFKKDFFLKALPIPENVEYHDAWFNSFACCMNGLNYVGKIVNNYRLYGNNASGNHKISFLKQVKTVFLRSGWKTDRVTYCDELLSRLPDMDCEIQKIILEAKRYHINRMNGKRLKTVLFTIKNYKRIYATNSYKQLFSRCIGILLKG